MRKSTSYFITPSWSTLVCSPLSHSTNLRSQLGQFSGSRPLFQLPRGTYTVEADWRGATGPVSIILRGIADNRCLLLVNTDETRGFESRSCQHNGQDIHAKINASKNTDWSIRFQPG